jgi:hypothetical protein
LTVATFTFPEFVDDRDSMTMFRTPPPSHGREEAIGMARRFGLDGDADDRGAYLLFSDESATLELFAASDSLRFSRWPSRSDEGLDGADPPDPETAAELAGRLLEEYGLGDRSARMASVTGLEVARADRGEHEGGRDPELRTVAAQVNYAFDLDDLPVMGAGAKIQLTLGGEGELWECLRFWRQANPVERMSPIGAREAFERLQRDPAYAALEGDAASVAFEEVRLGYLALPPREVQGYLLPVYACRGTVSTPELPSWAHTRYVIAVDLPPSDAKHLRVAHRPSGGIL